MKSLIRWIIIVAVLIVVILLVVKIVQESKIGTNASERKLILAAQKYYSEESYLLPRENLGTATVSSNFLINKGFLKQTTDINGAPKSCSSYVTVTNSNGEYFYNPFVKCGTPDDTLLLYDHLISIAKEESKDGTNGIFRTNNEYVFRGENPNNHLSFANKAWRIIGIDKNRNIKLIYVGKFATSRLFDDRYNLNTNNTKGINDYSVSKVKDFLITYLNDPLNYKNIDLAKFAYMDICIGERAIDDITTDGSAECSKLFVKQLVGLPSVNEFLNASNDINCPKAIKTCDNYNFMASLENYWTSTPQKGTTEKVYRVFKGKEFVGRDASSEHFVYPVISLKPDVAILSGNGSSADPYVLK